MARPEEHTGSVKKAETRPLPAKRRKPRAGANGSHARPVRESAREGARGAFRDAIVSAAERVFARSGFYETKMAEIAREAGVGVGTLYNYFESTEVIFA